MISVITCTYNTPAEVLARTWASLKAQTYTDWEWVVYDDSPGWDTYRQLYGFCADERYKVRIYRSHVPSGGMIGRVKHDAFMLGYGEILVELDHDDELTPDCLEVVKEWMDTGAEFVYSDWCELFPDGTSGKYPDGWAFGYGNHYWDEQYGVWAMKAPWINRTTISHIVSAPNHVRAWTSDLYHRLGGHDVTLPIADDYELCVRTALATNMVYIPQMLYKQHIGSHTAQRTRNALIQTLVAEIAEQYDTALYEKYGPKE
jgi:glycosyltransferase involved in cell wall biosynthesis